MKKMGEMSKKVGYDILTVSNDKITPVKQMGYNNGQILVIIDDYVCDKNQKDIFDYFIQGRRHNCSVIYLSQSYDKTPKDGRINCSHFCIYDFSSSGERDRMSREIGVDKEKLKRATQKPYSFLYVDNYQ